MPPAARAALVAALAAQPWVFAFGVPFWVPALMVPDGDATPGERAADAAG